MNEHYYAHTNEQRKQSLRDHLFGTAEIAQSKALPQLAYSAFFCGILHDGQISARISRKVKWEKYNS